MLSDDPDRIRALVIVAGNPVMTLPNTAKIEAALRKLDLLVTIDLYLSDTDTCPPLVSKLESLFRFQVDSC